MENQHDQNQAPPPFEAAPPPPAAPLRTFESMNLDPSVKQALDDMGYATPMEVQTAVFDHVQSGRDLAVQSRTGSGKTAAFGIPIANMLPASSQGVQALILAPTRELALQVSQEVGRICAYKNLQVVPVYGGAPMGRQVDALKAGAQIVAGTPGRVLDHIRRGTFKTDQVKMLVLDECDEMLSMGFLEEIEKIISELPPKDKRQTLLFSATMPDDIERIAKRHMRAYDKLALSDGNVNVQQIAHQYYMVSGLGRTRDLLRVIDFEEPESAIIFCNTREDTTMVAQFLQRAGYDAESISSDLSQSDRERVMGRSREKNLRFLVATDIAARGIDISDLSHVINYTFPESPEVYVHRTGRTGRAGKSGTAISLVGPREIGAFYYLKLIYKIRPEEKEFPSERELRTRREADRFEKVSEEVPEDAGDEFRSLARRVIQSADGERIVASVLKRLLEGAPKIVRDRAAEAAAQAELDRRQQATRRAESAARDAGPAPERDIVKESLEDRARRAAERERRGGDRDGGPRGRDGGRGPRRDDRGGPGGGRDDRGPRRDDRGERPREARAERSDAPRAERSDAPRAERSDAPRSDAPRAERSDAPRAERSDAPRSDAPRGERSDRPEAREPRGDRPERPRRERSERPERPAGERPERPVLTPAPEPPAGGENREFWEAWVDEKQRTVEPTEGTVPVVAGEVHPDAPQAERSERSDRGDRGDRSDRGDRGDRGDRAPSERRARAEEPPGSVRLYLNVGKREGLTVDDVASILRDASPELAAGLGRVTVRDTHSYASVKEEVAEAAIAALRGKKVGERELVAERAKAR